MFGIRSRIKAGLGRVSLYPLLACGLVLVLLVALAVWVRPIRMVATLTDPVSGEVRTVSGWDTSRLQAALAVWRQGMVLLAALVGLLVLGWHGRAWALVKAPAVRFFAASVFLHGLLLLGLGAVPLGRAVIAHAEVIRVNQAAELLDEGPQPAPRALAAAFEKVADLQPEAAATPSLVRQAMAERPPEALSGLVPTVPVQVARHLPAERLLIVPVRQPDIVRRPTELPRQSLAHVQPVELELEAPRLPRPEAAPQEKPIEENRVSPPRRKAEVATADGPELLRLPRVKASRPAELVPTARTAMEVSLAREAANPLAGRRVSGRVAAAELAEPEIKLKAEPMPSDSKPEDRPGTLPRLASVPLPPPALPELDRPASLPPLPRPSVPRLEPGEAMPRVASMSQQLARLPAQADREAVIEEKVLPQAALLLRQKEVRQRSLELFGGTAASEAAVERGLDWLAAHQSPNGSWSLTRFQSCCKHPQQCGDAGTAASDAAGTGLALLPFLGAGHTHQGGKHQQTVARGIAWLLQQQRGDGSWQAPEDSRPMYGQGLASIVLCEAYGMTQDPRLREPAQKALAYIVRAQHQPTGGWRYYPNQAADTSVVGWQVMALRSGEMAGLSVPPQALANVKRWLASVEGNKPVGGQFGYQSANPTPAMTAQGLLCLQYLGLRRDDPRMRAGTDYLLHNLPRPQGDTSYYWYHANQVMYHMQGEHWKAWNGKLRDLLVATQQTKGGEAGSWKPSDWREQPGGRLYATALRLLMLEVYYRHLPLYQQLER